MHFVSRCGYCTLNSVDVDHDENNAKRQSFCLELHMYLLSNSNLQKWEILAHIPVSLSRMSTIWSSARGYALPMQLKEPYVNSNLSVKLHRLEPNSTRNSRNAWIYSSAIFLCQVTYKISSITLVCHQKPVTAVLDVERANNECRGWHPAGLSAMGCDLGWSHKQDIGISSEFTGNYNDCDIGLRYRINIFSTESLKVICDLFWFLSKFEWPEYWRSM